MISSTMVSVWKQSKP